MPSHELIIFPGALGDLICLTPAIREIIRRATGGPVDLMARDTLARFSVQRMGIARAHSIDGLEVGQLFTKDGADSESAQAFFGNFARIHSFFAHHDVQFRRSLSAIVSETAFYPFQPSAEGHVAAAYLREIGAKVEGLPRASLKVLPADRQIAMETLARFGLRPGEYFLVFPGSGSLRKTWPAESFLRLVESLSPRLKPLIVLGPAEMALGDVLVFKGIATVSGQPLGTLAGLASMATLFVGNDSGVSHLASASGARGVVLFGPTDPARWRPLGQVAIIRREPLSALTVDEVAAALFRLIEEGNEGG